MRYNILKKHSTKAERIVYELLKELRIPFKHRWLVDGMECDFLINQYVLEINGHEQDGLRNHKLVSLGYVPIHFSNEEIINDRNKIKQIITNLWKQISLTV